MSERIHVQVYQEEEFGFSALVPAVPGLIYTRATLDEFLDDLIPALLAAGVEAGSTPVLHRVLHFETPEKREYLVSVAQDEHRAERQETAERLLRMLTSEDQRLDVFSDAPTLPTGEVMFVAVLPADELNDVASAFMPGTAALIAAPAGGPLIFLTRLATDDHPAASGDDWGQTEAGMTVQDVMLMKPAGSRQLTAL
jgi:hypothetical protein